MDERIEGIKSFILRKEQLAFRQLPLPEQADDFAQMDLNHYERAARRLKSILHYEKPVVLDFERIAYWRTVPNVPPLVTEAEIEKLKQEHFIYGKGCVCNICPNYAETIALGLDEKLDETTEQRKRYREGTLEYQFFSAVIEEIEAVLSLSRRYYDEAVRCSNPEIARVLATVPAKPAKTFHEALQFFRILHFTLWCEGEYHNTIGRFDQYMYDYLRQDLTSGELTYESAKELLAEFFLSFNKDSDLYPGIQLGDNGQSMVLGGMTPDGTDGYNMLSKMCLEVSKELGVIDPKINLRVSSQTPMEAYETGTELTKIGLGFPQYSNDDVVIKGLVNLGYEPEDARNYVVAACWEFIIPGEGMEIPNIGAMSFPKAVNMLLESALPGAKSFDEVLCACKQNIRSLCHELLAQYRDLYIFPAPFMSVLTNGCLENARDVSRGAKYNNYGLHGSGLSTAVDSLAAIDELVFRQKLISAADYALAVKRNFAGYDELLNRARYSEAKFGNNLEHVDHIACELLECFASALSGWRNERGGGCRAGTGSAMYYIRHLDQLGATPDGRRDDEPLGANYSPSLYCRTKGVLSVIKSFTKPNLSRTINGGPLTLEFQSNIFAESETKSKVARLVRTFIQLGGHQLQLNAVNPESLRNAQRNPQDYRNLIVRVWGWSAYFVELDEVYQNHIIQRQLYEA